MWRFTLLPHSKKALGSNPVWGVCIFSAWCLCRFSLGTPAFSQINAWGLIDDSKLAIGVNVNGCVCL